MKTRDVVLVVLDRVERNREWEVRKARMDAALLADWHLVLFEVEVGDPLLQYPKKKIV